MNMDAIGAYSRDTVYGVLSQPFDPKTVVVNAHTPYDEPSEENTVVNYDSFMSTDKIPIANVFNAEKFEKLTPIGIYGNNTDDNDNVLEKNYLPSFSLSNLKSSDIVNNALKLGYSPNEALVIYNSNQAYKNSIYLTENPVKSLMECSYEAFV